MPKRAQENAVGGWGCVVGVRRHVGVVVNV
jgi:hypothetical protein